MPLRRGELGGEPLLEVEADDGGEAGDVPDVYVVTNNHFRGQAAANAKMLESMVEQRKVEAPGELVERYPEALRPYAVAAANEPMSPELFPR